MNNPLAQEYIALMMDFRFVLRGKTWKVLFLLEQEMNAYNAVIFSEDKEALMGWRLRRTVTYSGEDISESHALSLLKQYHRDYPGQAL